MFVNSFQSSKVAVSDPSVQRLNLHGHLASNSINSYCSLPTVRQKSVYYSQ